MRLYEVKNGHIPQVAFGEKPEQGWLKVGPQTDRLWTYALDGQQGDFHTMGLIVVKSSHVSVSPLHSARMPYQTEGHGEQPIEFHGLIPVDEHTFNDIAVSGLLYRSGHYRGVMNIASIETPQQIAESHMRLERIHPHTFKTELAR